MTITQEDRDAAADLLAMAERIMPGGNDAAAIRNGIVLPEFVPFLDVVARHRIAAEQAGARKMQEAVRHLQNARAIISEGPSRGILPSIGTIALCIEQAIAAIGPEEICK